MLLTLVMALSLLTVTAIAREDPESRQCIGDQTYPFLQKAVDELTKGRHQTSLEISQEMAAEVKSGEKEITIDFGGTYLRY